MKKLILASTLLLASATASAFDGYPDLKEGPYVGAGFGTTKLTLDNVGSGNASTALGTVGYHFAQPWALEITYLRPKTLREDFGPISARYKGSGVTAQAVGHVPLGGPVQLVGSIGGLWWSEKYDEAGPRGRINYDDDGLDLIFGAGLGLAFERVWVRGMYERAEPSRASIGAWTLRATIHF